MNIYTSYFANYRNFASSAIIVSIALYPPLGFTGVQYNQLAPTQKILSNWKKHNDIAEYAEAYNTDVLKFTAPEEVFCNLEKISKGNDVIVVCYEKDTFCHRHLWADWMKSGGYEVYELPHN